MSRSERDPGSVTASGHWGDLHLGCDGGVVWDLVVNGTDTQVPATVRQWKAREFISYIHDDEEEEGGA